MSEGLVKQFKQLWPVLVFCCIAYAALQVKAQKLEDTAKLATATADEVSEIKGTLKVHGQMLTDIRDAVKDIARRRNHGD